MAYKLIYCAKIDDDKHKGMLKIGDTDFYPTKKLLEYLPNDVELINAANKRIKEWSGTAAAGAELVFCDSLIRFNEKTLNYEDYRDTEVHDVLQKAGFPKVEFDSKNDSGREWFSVDLETVKAALKATKEWRDYLDSSEMPVKELYGLRDEQNEAVEKTIKRFKNDNDMLWHAKMRFGKTITALTLVKKEQFKRTIIITHRPVVEDSWGSDFYHVFGINDKYTFLTKIIDSNIYYNEDCTDSIIDKANDERLNNLYKSDKNFVYFASIQDLRGSIRVGGKFDKNNAVFDIDWDLVIIDEAHEGTTTELGINVIDSLVKENTKRLDLSGTAYNLLDKYSDDKSVYTWDYVMEQQAKKDWILSHPYEKNPYLDMPVMHINTFDLESYLSNSDSCLINKGFSFHEFFRTWTGDLSKDGAPIPEENKLGGFVHKDSVKHFLDLLSVNEEKSKFPFIDANNCKQNLHTLWMVPGVKEAKALSEMLQNHSFFSMFGIANVAGDGDHDEEKHFNDALKFVRDTIENHERTITISCGRLTTGVTVKDWSSVFMMSDGSDAKQYMQTIFRVQSSGMVNGKQKTDCYVYDFAPDRALKVVAETAGSRKHRGGIIIDNNEQHEAFATFLNFCPIVAIDGAEFKPFSVEALVKQINRIHIDRALKSGFMDNCIYDLSKFKSLTSENIDKINSIFKKLNKSKSNNNTKEAGLADNGTGSLDRNHDKGKVNPGRTSKTEDEKNQKKLEREIIEKLSTVSIRIPLLFYSGEFELEEGRLADAITSISESSWNVFMPKDFTPDDFKELVQYYNQETVIGAAKEIRNRAISTDALSPTDRVLAITDIFSTFHNPSHETVLTPWRVVNLHLSETLGGYCFYNTDYEENNDKYYKRLLEPRHIDNPLSNSDILSNPNSKVLEINSKSGLYPLYVAYSIYRAKLHELNRKESDMTPEQLYDIWDAAAKQVYVICQSEMAESITQMTLFGKRRVRGNIKCENNIVDRIKENINSFVNEVNSGSYWGQGDDSMNFDAVVGNPPYHEVKGKNRDIWQHFVYSSVLLSNNVSLIHPGRWLVPKSQMVEIHDKLLNLGLRVIDFYPDANNLFSSVSIDGGITITVFEKNYVGEIDYYNQGVYSGIFDNNSKFLSNKYEEEIYEKFNVLMFDNKSMDSRVVGNIGSLGGGEYGYKKQSHITMLKDTSDGLSAPIKVWANKGTTKGDRFAWYYIEKACLNEIPVNIVSSRKVMIDKKGHAITTGKGNIFNNPPQIVDKNAIASGDVLFVFPEHDNDYELQLIKSLLLTKTARFLMSITQKDLYVRGFENIPDYTCFIDELDGELFTDEFFYKKYCFSPELISHINSTISDKK